jgi:hypothetical protein
VKKYLREAHQALLEGDREAVLRMLEGRDDSPEALWLLAHASRTEAERKKWLQLVAATRHSTFSPLAKAILEREGDFEEQLSKPPDYQFWKQSTWEMRYKQIKGQWVWLIITAVFIFLIFMLINQFVNPRANIATEAVVRGQTQTVEAAIHTHSEPTPKDTIADLPLEYQQISSYSSGSLTLRRIETPVERPVVFNSGYDRQRATPAVGAYFAAFELEFICKLPICSNPPEADILLLLRGGERIEYSDYDRPRLEEDIPMARISSGQSTQSWFIFEIPTHKIPEALIVKLSNDEEPQQIDLPSGFW